MIKRWVLLTNTLLLVSFMSPLCAAELQGRIEWPASITLATNLDTEVIQAYARPGQRVKKGEVLLQFVETLARARLEQARAEMAHQKLLRNEAQSELQRSEELYDRTLLSDHDLNVARIGAAAAEADYQRAMVDLKEAQHALGLCRIVAPFDALVIERHVQAGETVNGRFKSVPLFTLVDSSSYRVRLELGEAPIPPIVAGAPIEVGVGKRRYRGEIGAITFHREKDIALRSMIDILFVPGSGETLQLGEVVRVTLP